MDTDSDGLLTVQDLKEGFGKLFGKDGKNYDRFFREIIKEIDLAGCGRITYNEFIVAGVGRQNLFKMERLEEVFQSLDIHDHGLLGIEELKAMLSEYSEDNRILEEFLKSADIDKDGYIDLKEFINSIRAN